MPNPYQIPVLHLVTFIAAGIGTFISLWLIYLIIKHRSTARGWYYLIGWIVLLGIIDQVNSIIIMSSVNAEFVLRMYRLGTVFIILVPLFYLFVREYLNIMGQKWLVYTTYIYCLGVLAATMFWPKSLILNLVWDNQVKFFEPVYNTATEPFYYIGVGLWLVGIFLLARTYFQSNSAISRNRLKYLFWGGVLPLLGFITISVHRGQQIPHGHVYGDFGLCSFGLRNAEIPGIEF